MSDAAHPRRLGRYALYDRIASGGMATVYFGQLLGTGGFTRIVAVKRLHPHLAEEKEFASMLLDEAYLAGRIRHPNVVSTLDVVSSEGELFVVMDYVHGETLARLLKATLEEKRRIPVEVATAVMVGVLNGLHAAHETTNQKGEPLHLIHRDVSPQNIVVGVDGVPRLLDFGVAKAQHRLSTTRDGRVKGKLAYMSVEQLTNQPIDRRTDIYSAGVVLWELLAGKRLFAGENESSTLNIILMGTHPPPSRAARDVPAELDRITMRALARSASARYDTARQMAVALESAMPMATARTVGEWVESLAEPQLAERARIMRAIDAGGGSHSEALPPIEPSSATVSADPDAPGGVYAAPQPAGPHPPSPIKRWLGYLVAGAVGAALLFLALLRYNRPGANVEPRAAPTTPAAGQNATPSIAPVPVSTNPPVPSAQTVASAPLVVATAPPAAGAVRARSPSRATHQGVAAPASKSDCNPPYTVDANGVRRYKVNCPLE